MEQVILSGAALSWHVGDLILNRKDSSRKRKVWIGVGVGWAAFWFAKMVLQPKPLVETKRLSVWHSYNGPGIVVEGNALYLEGDALYGTIEV